MIIADSPPNLRLNWHSHLWVGRLVLLRKVKGALSGLRQFLTNESPLKMMKNAIYFTLKALFVLKMFKFLS